MTLGATPGDASNMHAVDRLGTDIKHPEMDGIAIVGMSFKFPGGLESEDAFWEALLEKRNTATEFPKDRLSADGAFHPQNRKGTIPLRGGHFLTSDIARFDAPFFSISDTEAASLDPQQRGLLETTYRALENAGLPMQRVSGSKTSVFTGCFTNDWQHLALKDAEQCTQHAGIGFEPSILANRLSWFFNLRGTSFNVDSACSSSLVCVDLACKDLLNKDADMSIAAGCNLVFYPDIIHALSNLQLLSPDSQSYSFDSRANGYARGEGFGVLILKRLHDAVRDRDCIRAVIRGSGSNHDGRTTGLTNPSKSAQSQLIRDTYARARLSMTETRFVEAHGTGTAMGDPIEANAIGETFRSSRQPNQPLYVGALKSNIGHLEGASGIAGVIKTILVLEKGIIPPNANFVNINPRIDPEGLCITLPNKAVPWPAYGLRRASVNSFGFGGTNAHIILDDALHYLKDRSLLGNHQTVLTPTLSENYFRESSPAVISGRSTLNGTNNGSMNGLSKTQGADGSFPRLFAISAGDKETLGTHATLYADHVRGILARSTGKNSFLEDFIYTMSARRTTLPWRTTTIVESVKDLTDLSARLPPAQQAIPEPALCLVFTGQGAQYPGGAFSVLQRYDAYRRSLEDAEEYLQRFGCKWKVREELHKHEDVSKINDPEFSQPITTILQVALTDLLCSFNIYPKTVIGHSSGEIAAAYCKGALSRESAWKIAYFRGVMSSSRATLMDGQGAMMAIALSKESVLEYLDRIQEQAKKQTLTVACINSPNNVTIAGGSAQMDALESILVQDGVFARRLKVDIAYHTPYMNRVAQRYLESIVELDQGTKPPQPIAMISTVLGKEVPDEALCTPQYWVDNMTSPVLFAAAVGALQPPSETRIWESEGATSKRLKVTIILEVGFHSALKGPIRDCLGAGATRVGYESVLIRDKPPLNTLINAFGRLFCHGCPVDPESINSIGASASTRQAMVLCDLPEYPFNHAQRYWEEGRVSKRLRLHGQGKLDLLGKPNPDWNESEAKWRNFIRIGEMPWVEDHQINGSIVYPAAGMLVMAIEAAKQVADENRTIQGYELRDVVFLSALTVPTIPEGIETHLHLREIRDASSTSNSWSEFRLFSFDRDEWHENCRGSIRTQYHVSSAGVGSERDRLGKLDTIRNRHRELESAARGFFDKKMLYETLQKSGYEFGPSFQLVQDGCFGPSHVGKGDIKVFEWPEDCHPQPHVVHPCTLDALLHFSIAAFTQGGTVTVPTAVPSLIRKCWIANHGLSMDGAEIVRAAAWLTEQHDRGAEFDISVLDEHESKVLMEAHGLQLTVVAEKEEATSFNTDAGQICYHLDFKPDLELLNLKQLTEYCGKARMQDHEPIQFFNDLTFLLLFFLTQAMSQLKKSNVSSAHPHLLKYFDWAKTQLSLYADDQLPHAKQGWVNLFSNEADIESKCRKVEEANELGRAYVATGRKLTAILKGDTDALEFLFASGLLEGLYREVNSQRACFDELSHFLDALGHKNPGQKIVEVGAGTGGTTEKILRSLSAGVHGISAEPRYSVYCYTDISASFFESAPSKFFQYPNVEYKVLDVELDPESQNFDCGTFDVVVAANVLHATCSIATTLKNVRKLLKPGGYLIIYEPTRPEILRTAFIMGLLPGWWLASEPERKWGPTMSCESWDRSLRENGFSGSDLELPDFVSPECREGTIIVSKAIPPRTNGVHVSSNTAEVVLVMDKTSTMQQDVAQRLHSILPQDCLFANIEEAVAIEGLSEKCLVFLQEIWHPWLFDLSESHYSMFQNLTAVAHRILWVTAGGGSSCPKPEYGVVNGLFRVLRNEEPKRRYVTLALNIKSSVTNEHLESIGHMLRLLEEAPESMEDMEYVEIDGLLQLPRVVPESVLSEELLRRSLPHQYQSLMIKNSPPLKLSIGSVGLLDTLHFTDGEDSKLPLNANEVEVEVRSIGLNFRDCLMALGRVPSSSYGSECSGIVCRVGDDCSLSVGDRVAMSSSSTFRTHARAKEGQVVKIPDAMTFSEAASIPTQFCTAWQAIHEKARLQKGESILIHSAAGGTGQAAVQVARYIGGIVYATVGSDTKKNILVKEYGIPDDHIFYSRDSTFAEAVMRRTNNRGVDVVLNSLAGDGLVSSWECIAPHGRFIELGKWDMLSNSKLPMYPFLKNASFMCFDGFTWQFDRPEEAHHTLETVFRQFEKGPFHVARPLHVYSLEHTEEAFRSMQEGTVAGKIVLDLQKDTTVKTMLPTRPSFYIDNRSSYVVAGGLGGLGRSISRWLVTRGAKHLILLSRSGVREGASREFLDELERQGVVVRAPACDITDSVALENVLRTCQEELPPIKGCIQGSMVLRDAVFESMEYRDWRLGTDCKTIGSWNLHRLLLRDLDFFVMLSSASGIVGLHGQANYAAGNSYLDALAHYRVSIGERGVSLDLGAMTEDGLLAENPDFLNRVLGYGALNGIGREYFYAILDYYCNPSVALDISNSQPIIGLGSGMGVGRDGMAVTRQLLLRHLNDSETRSAGRKVDVEQASWKERFSTAGSPDEAAQVVAMALVEKLQRILGSVRGDVDMNKSVAAYGVDSLLAVELRSWLAKEFQADVSLFEISNGASFSALSMLVVSRSKARLGS
ncbi:reducing type I polyketide synthase [Polyplosphaeria fusca]|uniref:Reducing type I polyketide synthase n=1 Tax=Polyplosphaeria fusca TaxID=682080 RepID=A0A9P4QJ66_9PLEO|nr:reducing type I polyketide synthase [Polyplosphaeria fusca]